MLPIFLSVIAAGITAGGPANTCFSLCSKASAWAFVLSALTHVAAAIGHGTIRGVRRVGVYLQPPGAVVLPLAGGYIVY